MAQTAMQTAKSKTNVVSWNQIVDLKLNDEKVELFKESKFYSLIKIKNKKLTSAALIEVICSMFVKVSDDSEPTNGWFQLNDGFKFTVDEVDVARALGIAPGGDDASQVKAEVKSFPSFVLELEKLHCMTKEKENRTRSLSCKSLKTIVQQMGIDTDEKKDQFKQLLRYHLIENFLIPSSDNYCRLENFKFVRTAQDFESVNWAKLVRESIFSAAWKIKNQKLFTACSLVFQERSTFTLAPGLSSWNALVFEIVMTFGLVYTVYATAVDPRKGNLGIIAPIAIGLIVGANILVGGAFDGAAMNPAVTFGPAVMSWTWTHHWVYWLGPFIGAALAAIIYDHIYIGDYSHQHLPTDY